MMHGPCQVQAHNGGVSGDALGSGKSLVRLDDVEQVVDWRNLQAKLRLAAGTILVTSERVDTQ